MAAIAAIAGVIGAGLSLFGTITAANQQRQQAGQERQLAQFNAMQEERRAQQERATAQRQALERRRLTQIAQSTLQARAAASGGKATDASVIQLSSDIAGRGEYQALTEMFSGESRARALEDKAGATRFEGEARAQAAEAKAKSMLLSGFGSLFTRLGGAAGGGGLKFG